MEEVAQEQEYIYVVVETWDNTRQGIGAFFSKEIADEYARVFSFPVRVETVPLLDSYPSSVVR